MAWWVKISAVAPSLFTIVFGLSLISSSEPLFCGPCNKTACANKALTCHNGMTFDACRCCQVCTKTLNETCGGPQDSYGACGQNLKCVLSLTIGQQITGHEVGKCRVASPDKSKCNGVTCDDGKPGHCPLDSYRKRVSDETAKVCCLSGTTSMCVCNASLCPVTHCLPGYTTVLVHPALNQPGRCCNLSKCQPKETQRTCVYKGKVYQNRATWDKDLCSHCTCKDGLVFCETVSCPTINCDYMIVPKGKCCPVCRGCLSPSRGLYNNSETWQENKCTQCRCDDYKLKCVSQTCQINCVTPRHLPNTCCPVCKDINNDPQLEQPGSCPDLSKCHKKCLGGFKVDSRGCFLCSCKSESCGLICKYGLAKAANGAELCRCREPKPLCEPLVRCNKQCIYGFKKSRLGCNKCKCNKCPQFVCNKKCLHGYVFNDKGCEVCKCRGSKVRVIVPEVIEGRGCLTSSGHNYADGETWHDGCRRCFCHNGKEMCYLIRCAAISCSNPVFRLGDCCPSCPGSSNKIRPIMAMCRTVDGQHFNEGETWNLDSCTECICHEGLILCETQTCPPLLCHHPTKIDSKCCPTCKDKPDNSGLVTSKPRSCYARGRISYRHGTVWRVSPCQSCSCSFGLIHCYSQMCPRLKCQKLILRKGQCCPTCLERDRSKPCESNGLWYSDSEEWREGCSSCRCTSPGLTRCHNVSCPHLDCVLLVRKRGSCCPICLEGSGFQINHDMKMKSFLKHGRNKNSNVTNFSSHRNSPVDKHSTHLSLIVVLSVLLTVTLVALILVILVLFRRRRTGFFRTSDHMSTTDIKVVPCSTNCDLRLLYDLKCHAKQVDHCYDRPSTHLPGHGSTNDYSENGMLLQPTSNWNTLTTDVSSSPEI